MFSSQALNEPSLGSYVNVGMCLATASIVSCTTSCALRVSQAGFSRRPGDQPPISIVKLLSTALILPILQSPNQRGPRVLRRWM